MQRKILFIDTTHPYLPDTLSHHGFSIEHFYEKNYSELKLRLSDAYGCIIRSKFPIDSEFLSYAPQLKFIGRVGAGLENIDTDECAKRGITIFNAPEGNRDSVAEHSLAMLLALNNRLLIADAEVRNGIWKREENRGTEICGKTIGIIGYGNMGAAFAQRLAGFGVHVIAYDKYKFGFGNDLVQEVSMNEIFANSDMVSLHIPLTDETLYLVNNEWIDSFKKPFTLINTSRGKIVKTKDLSDALVSGKVVGACLDVLEYESRSFEETFSGEMLPELKLLMESKNVVFSPHIAGWTHESNLKLASVLVEKILSEFKQ